MTEERAAAMARRLLRTAERAGVDAAGSELIAHAFDLAISHRNAWIDDAEHPEYLHTARTVLILLDDARCGDARTLAAAALFDSTDGALIPSPSAMARLPEEDIAGLVSSVPAPWATHEALLERLVSAPSAALLIAIAEHLDHARHLHIRPPAGWGAFHALSRDAYLPAAGRASRALERRLDWWCRMFASRFLGADSG